jgi:hypothetical protein
MAFDARRSYLHEYSLKEQIEILSLGANKIREWIGVYPTAHRAGMYGINADTFQALERVGISYDCSWFYGNRNCKLSCSIRNKPFRLGNTIEIPVTVFKKIVTVRNPVATLKAILVQKEGRQSLVRGEQFKKLDTRYGATLEEIKKVITESDPKAVIILFLHSFNFLDLVFNLRKRTYESIRVNDNLIKSFEELLLWISKQESCRFSTIDDLKIDYEQRDVCIEVDSGDNRTLTGKAINLFRTHILHKIDL